MKKSLIATAGVAAFAVAAVPMAAFATDVTTQTDTLEITIDKICSFGHTDSDAGIDVTGVAHTPGAGNWGTEDTADTLSKTMSNGTTSNNLGSTTLGVFCNNEKGYQISTTGAGALASSTTTDTIDVNEAFSATSSGWSYQVAAGTGTNQRGEVKNSHGSWATSANVNDVIAGSKSTAPKTTANEGDYFTVTYGAGIDNTQAAGVYSGTITYNLAQLN